jgi:uncharacterized membrane protein YhaH (DUF805 family)
MKKYFDFTRRATRSEFWGVFVANVLISLVGVGLIVSAPALTIVWMLAMLASFVAYIATLVSRIRDSGHSVLWIIACMIPYIAFIVVIVFGCLQSKK